MDSEVKAIVSKAMNDGLLSEREIRALFSVKDFSPESAYIQWAARSFSSALMKGKAEVHGQLGIDTGQCPKNCQFCSFAAGNKAFPESSRDSVEKIVQNVVALERAGANAIYVMATATYSFDDYLAVAERIVNERTTKLPLIANIGDFNERQAQELKDVGFSGVYHAIRLGEGTVTRIPVERRWKTIEAVHAAGLVLGTCVEPVGPEHSIDELIEKTVFTREMNAVFSGAMRRTLIPSSPLASYGQVSYAHMALIVAVVALATGVGVPGNCTHEPNPLGVAHGANLVWAEVGSNPRDTEAETVRGWTVSRCRELYQECGWDVLEGPSVLFDGPASA